VHPIIDPLDPSITRHHQGWPNPYFKPHEYIHGIYAVHTVVPNRKHGGLGSKHMDLARLGWPTLVITHHPHVWRARRAARCSASTWSRCSRSARGCLPPWMCCSRWSCARARRGACSLHVCVCVSMCVYVCVLGLGLRGGPAHGLLWSPDLCAEFTAELLQWACGSATRQDLRGRAAHAQ